MRLSRSNSVEPRIGRRANARSGRVGEFRELIFHHTRNPALSKREGPNSPAGGESRPPAGVFLGQVYLISKIFDVVVIFIVIEVIVKLVIIVVVVILIFRNAESVDLFNVLVV